MRTATALCVLTAALIGQTPFTSSGSVTVTYEGGVTEQLSVAIGGVERMSGANGSAAATAHVAITVGTCDYTGTVQATIMPDGSRLYTVSFDCGGKKVVVGWTLGHPAADATIVRYSYVHPHHGPGFGEGTW